jgi:YidC/Oxa1 family membrane protein insertase
MNDIRRTILMMVFGFSLVLLWDQWQISQGRKATFFPTPTQNASSAAGATPAKTTTRADQALPVNGAPQAADASIPTAASGLSSASPTSAVPLPTTAPAAPVQREIVTVQTDVLRLSFDAEGATLVKAELLKHVNNAAGVKGDGGPVVLMDQSTNRAYVAQTGLIGAIGNNALPNHKTIFKALDKSQTLADGADALNVRFEATDANGIKLSKTYSLKRGSYSVNVKHDVTNGSTNPISTQVYLQLVRDGNDTGNNSMFYSTFTGPAVYSDEAKYQKIDFKAIEKKSADFVAKTTSGYVAMVQHYFASAWILPASTARENYARKVDNNLYSAGTIAAIDNIGPNQTKGLEATLFIGPQEETSLKTITPGLELVKDYGWFTILAKPLYTLLTFIYSVVGNWGWSIVGLVLMLKIAFYWLNAKAYRSMAKMKAVNPKVMEMRERYKDKPQQMQQEMMRIYREEKVNPMGGCFPILIQIPVFIALYWVLLSSVEVRNAPWILWIKDLSAPDPWFLLPLIMTGTTMLQTWLNPTPTDPLQAKIMWFMPLIFSVMFFFFPAGLVLYWTTNNILSIAQQWLINKQLGVLGKG